MTSSLRSNVTEAVVLVVCWSPKGGSGTSTVATSLAVAASRHRSSASTVIVDLDGDIPAILSMVDTPVGVGEWFTQPAAYELRELFIESSPKLHVLPRGVSPLPEPRSGAWSRFALALRGMSSEGTTIVVDAGTGPIPEDLADAADSNFLIVRPCYLALRRARSLAGSARPPSQSVVVVGEPNRVLTVADVESVLGLPIAAHIAFDSDIARRVDAGVIASHPPTRLMRNLLPFVESWGVR